ncbi:UDP-glucose/GDP-mannose dehydrogenase family protein [Exilibacterium tricleocarpae]|uniref:UDP-glucose 6-dehydrogenase n=1 Tax=Exilibacterium tricleocarpae TaxID=2591008 RepID=A0A545U455_9GAMM|nr:UDP-glucose/GDP-mannose dehydrogenase family protein [Exilibacterium tricleocarpae]TQV84250.1 UDP-glucose/GDP-mannose dehydrogenase family protein [Exilibacterium tricleocarpae]
MKIAIFGTGYVGLVTGACLAQVGHNVCCVDVDKDKVASLRAGVIPIYEPGLKDVVEHAVAEGRLSFTTDAREAVDHGEVIFIAVGTPPDEDGSADLRYVLAVGKTVAEHMQDYRLVVTKSTVPVGTADKVKSAMTEVLEARAATIAFDVASNPEFLKEGAAVSDFMKPDRIVVGTDSPRVEKLMRELYAPFNRNHDKLIFTDVRSSELTKYAANALLATKISFMNELANIAEKVGADIEQVRQGIGSDPRIGYHFIYPGCGYGGSCFPKDVKALVKTAEDLSYAPQLLSAVDAVNDRQKERLFQKLRIRFGDDLTGKTIALWGLAFKPNTDDMREAPSRTLMEALWAAGAKVRAFDPEALHEAERLYGDRDDLQLCSSAFEVLDGADALVICTEWQQFRSPDFAEIKQRLTHAVIVDGRNLYDPALMAEKGIEYFSIGRGR